jgi:hypothetical protein
MKQLKHLYFARKDSAGLSASSSRSEGNNNNSNNSSAMMNSGNNSMMMTSSSSNSASRSLAVDSLAVGGDTRTRSLQIIQQAIDQDWIYVVPASKPTKKMILLMNNNQADDDVVSDQQQQQFPKRRQRERKDEEESEDGAGMKGGKRKGAGGGGGGDDDNNGGGGGDQNRGGGGGSGGALISTLNSGLQESTLLGGRGLCISLYQQHNIEISISTRLLKAVVHYPKGNFLPNILMLPSSGSPLFSMVTPQNQQHLSRQDQLIENVKRMQDGFWDVILTKDLSSAVNASTTLSTSTKETRISLVSDPPSSCFVYPSQLVITEGAPKNNSSSSSTHPHQHQWTGAFRIVPLKEGKIDMKISVITMMHTHQTQQNNKNSSSSSDHQQQSSSFSARVQVKKRFPVDDQSLYKAPPVLFYRGIGSASLLPALGLNEVVAVSSSSSSTTNPIITPTIDGRLIANSVKRMLEPVPAIMQSVAIGAVVGSSNRIASLISNDDIKFAENLCFQQSNNNFNSSNQQQQHQNALEIERAARIQAAKQRKEDEENNKNDNNKNDGGKKRNNSRHDLKFCNAHMLHMGIDTRKPFFQSTNGEDASFPLESMES